MTGGGYVTVKQNILDAIQNGGKKEQLIDVIEKKMQRFDNLIIKHKNGQALTEKEQEELLKLTPQVSLAIVTISKLVRRLIKIKTGVQKGGAGNETTPQEIAAVVDIIATTEKQNQKQGAENQADANADKASVNTDSSQGPAAPAASAPDQGQNSDDKEKLKEYLKALEEKQRELIDEGRQGIETASKDAQLLSDLINEIKAALLNENNEPVKYPDLGNTVLNTVSNAIKKIKDWFYKLLGNTNKGASDRLKNMIKLPEGKEEGEHTLEAVDKTTSKIEKTINKHFKTIANSGVETILNAFSLVPGIGTTLQLWRLVHSLANLITGTVDNATELQDNVVEGVADVTEAGKKDDAKAGANASTSTTGSGTPTTPSTPQGGHPNTAVVGGGRNKHSRRNNIQEVKHFTRRLKSVEEYRREYNKAKREINKTKHRIIKSLRNYISI